MYITKDTGGSATGDYGGSDRHVGALYHAVEELLPEADIAHDKFHIAKYLGDAMDKVRKSEHKGLKKEGAETLKGTKYFWLTHPRNWSDEQKQQFKKLKCKGLQVGRARAIKELFSELWEYTYEKSARNFFRKWYWWATHSWLKPIAEVAKKLKRHMDNILTYLRHRVTNAVAEGDQQQNAAGKVSSTRMQKL